MRANLREAVSFHHSSDVRRLIAAVLQNQPAVLMQMRRRTPDYGRQGFEARGPVAESEGRFRGQFLERRVRGADIGWIGDDQVEALAGHGREPGPQAPIDVREPKVARIPN